MILRVAHCSYNKTPLQLISGYTIRKNVDRYLPYAKQLPKIEV